MAFTPEFPTLSYAESKDGKKHLYLIASNEVDIEMMLYHAGLKTNGIYRQKDKFLDGYYRIIKEWEEPIIKKVFP